MLQATNRDLNIAYAFFERNWNLTRRYIGWEVVWLVYSLVNALTILFIAAATERGIPVVITPNAPTTFLSAFI